LLAFEFGRLSSFGIASMIWGLVGHPVDLLPERLRYGTVFPINNDQTSCPPQKKCTAALSQAARARRPHPGTRPPARPPRRQRPVVNAVLFAPPNAGAAAFVDAFNAAVNARRLAFASDLVPQVPCPPTMAACGNTPVPTDQPGDAKSWPYAQVDNKTARALFQGTGHWLAA
jgi:hypothetical protein